MTGTVLVDWLKFIEWNNDEKALECACIIYKLFLGTMGLG